jgi:hypothetical protein
LNVAGGDILFGQGVRADPDGCGLGVAVLCSRELVDQHRRGSDKQVEQQRSASAGAARVLVDLPARYLDAPGAIKADPGIDRKLVEFATAFVALATRATVHITQPLATA